MTKTVAITGAAGYIGSRVVESLSNQGVRVMAIVHPEDLPARIARIAVLPLVQVIKYDVLGPATGAWAAIGSPDVCVHMAWKNGFNHQDPLHIGNVGKHYAFLTALVDQGLPQLAVAGTAHEIGFFEGCVRDTTPANPINNYGVAKNFLRQAMFAYCAGKPTVLQWLRFFYIVGHDRENQSVFTKLFQAADRGDKTFGLNHGEILYDFIHVETLGAQIATAVGQKEIAGIINCCTGKPVTLKTQVTEFVREHRLPITLEFGKFPLRAYDSHAIWGDATAISTLCKA